MNKLSILTILICFGFACTNRGKDDNAGKTAKTLTNAAQPSTFITIDSANKMIQSYLTSINYPDNKDSLLSLSLNANDLRTYLADTSITDIKLMFAHRLDYINAGDSGKYCGYSTHGLTLVVAAFNSLGNYVFHNGTHVMDYATPCPYNCPPGTASNALLIAAP